MRRYWFGILTFAFLCLSFAWAGAPAEFKGHDGYIPSVAFSSDGALLATASLDGTAKIWDFASGKEKQILKGHTGRVDAIAFNKDGSVVATGGADGAIRFWNPADGKTIKEILKAHAGGTLSVAFNPAGTLLASAGADKAVKLWDAKEAKELKAFTGHKETVYSVAFNKDGTQFASCGNDGVVKVYDVKSLAEIKSMMVDLPKPVMKKEEPKKEEPEKKDKKEPKKKDMVKKDEPKEIRDAFIVVLFSPDGKQVLTGGNDKFLRFWNIDDGKEAKKIGPTPDYIYGLAISRDGKYVATAGYGGSLRVYELASGKRVYPETDQDEKKDKEKLAAADGARRREITYCLAFTPDGKAVVTGQEDQKNKKGITKVTPVIK